MYLLYMHENMIQISYNEAITYTVHTLYVYETHRDHCSGERYTNAADWKKSQIRLTAVLVTDVSRHHGGPIAGPLKSLAPPQHYRVEGLHVCTLTNGKLYNIDLYW